MYIEDPNKYIEFATPKKQLEYKKQNPGCFRVNFKPDGVEFLECDRTEDTCICKMAEQKVDEAQWVTLRWYSRLFNFLKSKLITNAVV